MFLSSDIFKQHKEAPGNTQTPGLQSVSNALLLLFYHVQTCLSNTYSPNTPCFSMIFPCNFRIAPSTLRVLLKSTDFCHAKFLSIIRHAFYYWQRKICPVESLGSRKCGNPYPVCYDVHSNSHDNV